MNEVDRDWETYSLGSICELRRGITYSSAMLEAESNGLPYINMKSFLKGGGFNKDGTKRYAGFHTSNDLIDDQDLLIANTDVTAGDIVGVPALLPSELRGEKVLYSHHVTRLRLKGTVTVPFLYYLLCLPEYRSWMLKFARGTTVLMLDMSAIKRIPVRVPKDRTIQHRITEILSVVDAAIEQTEALIAKYQQIKLGMMQDLFTSGVTPDGRLRPTRFEAPQLYKESELGWIPKEWQVRKLGEILRESGGYLQTGPFGSQLHAYEYEDDGVPVVMPQDINDGAISIEQIARILERRAQELSRHRMREGDIVIARRGELSRASYIDGYHEGWLCGSGCFLLRLGRGPLNPKFVARVYRHDLIQRQIAAVSVGTTMSSLNNAVMERLFFPLCDSKEQSRIVERLDSIDQFLGFTVKQAQKLTDEKHGLMHDLLTGEVPVKVKGISSHTNH